MQKYSDLFVKTKKEAPKDETSTNAKLLIRAGFINKEIAGAYSLLPFGIKTLEKINSIIRDEMNKLGGVEIRMTSLQGKELWEKTGRWDDKEVDVWFKTQLAAGGELGLGLTHEEPIASLLKEHISSYRDLPVYVYQIQTKFRNELRAKSGIMRGREFLMKDLYSFNKSEEDLNKFYEDSKVAYTNVFNRVGIGDKTFITFASGGMFSKYSHEFQTISEAGEDIIYVDKEKNIAINQEVYTDEVIKETGVKKEKLEKFKSIEVGNIFKLGTKYSNKLGLKFTNEQGEEKDVIMGSYGIGCTRLMGTIVEVSNDDRGIIWPKSVTPYEVHLITLGDSHKDKAQELIEKLEEKGLEVLWDDREETGAGQKFADADLIGIPVRLVLSDRSIQNGGVEYKERAKDESEIISLEEVVEKVTNFYLA